MALWGGRFSESTGENVQNFTESISYDKRLYKYDIAGSKAHATMLSEAGIIPAETGHIICDGLTAIEKRIDVGDFEFKKELEDIHMHVESALIEALGDEGARVHTARSRNDQINLDIRLYLRDAIDDVCAGVRCLQTSLVNKAAANSRDIMPGFTHLQHAQPVLFAHHLLAYVEMFARDIGRLEDTKKRLNVLTLGSGAIAGTTLPINRERVRELLNFPACSRNSMDAVADRDFMCELLSALSIFSMHISRLSEDLILWMSQEFQFMVFSDSYCTGSSLMPQKKNPDIAELSRGKTGRVYGDLIALLTLCKGLPLTYNRDLQEDKEPVFDALDTVFGVLSVYPGMIDGMKINKAKMLSAASDPGLIATDIAEALVRKGVPFRNAHRKVGALVKYAQDHNKPLDQLTVEEMQEVFPEADAQMLSLFSPEKSVAARDVFGGTGFNQVQSQIDFWKKQLNIK